MSRAHRASRALLAAAGACSGSSAGARAAPSSCGADSDCPGGAVCGYSNVGTYADCAARGVCVTPVDRTPTMLCGCGGKPVDLVVDEPDAGIYYWSGVIVGEQGFPACGDAAVAPSSGGADAASQ